ncbi:hypothetical protein L1987_32431 [Smallanthus sonchifolius]|uniref:Uncharacterized protein n=1 Tax=Smallanthus sonchifolius TaxID=185202 RepID=A0ACB9HPD6_9ASTR|nr:hypothetical protein L1987_32431 [Smallanthus sonchifolius]
MNLQPQGQFHEIPVQYDEYEDFDLPPQQQLHQTSQPISGLQNQGFYYEEDEWVDEGYKVNQGYGQNQRQGTNQG